ncbi:hypothetical protein [Luteolibacter flavescens]|nr:hypothetical protein [Luteolibacter flavescens]
MPATIFERPPAASSDLRESTLAKLLAVKRWKHLMPDGASWFRGGFSKASLKGGDPSHLRRFVVETRRGEACHWAALATGPVFFLWNPLWADAVMVSALLLLNLPCIAIQRYNRIRFERLLAKYRHRYSNAPARSDLS